MSPPIGSEKNTPGYVLNFTFQNGGKWLKIVDVRIPKGSHKGYGTTLLDELVKIEKKLKVSKIWGNLDYEDEEHKKIQVAFYNKFGSTIDEDRNYIELPILIRDRTKHDLPISIIH